GFIGAFSRVARRFVRRPSKDRLEQAHGNSEPSDYAKIDDRRGHSALWRRSLSGWNPNQRGYATIGHRLRPVNILWQQDVAGGHPALKISTGRLRGVPDFGRSRLLGSRPAEFLRPSAPWGGWTSPGWASGAAASADVAEVVRFRRAPPPNSYEF